MIELTGKRARYALNEQGMVVSFQNLLSGHEYVLEPGELWKLIYAEGERTEIPVYSSKQKPNIEKTNDAVTLTYDALNGDGRVLDVSLTVRLQMEDKGLRAAYEIKNRDAARVMEFSLSAASGLRTLSGAHEKDAIAWPVRMGIKVPDPAYSDLSVYAGFRKYECHDQYHTDLSALYPSRMSMAWFDWYNEGEGLYVASHALDNRTVLMHVERDTNRNLMTMGVIQYPMLERGESYQSADIVYYPHLGDWHAGAKLYRAFMEASGRYQVPTLEPWTKDFSGWLRVILKQHHMECNWTYKDSPRLFDEAEAAGFKTIFLLGWEEGGFARMWPDYIPDEGALGGVKLLKQGIDYVHQKGGKVFLFLSYALIDHQSDFYKNGPGKSCTIKSIWGEEVPFAETYCGEGTYRKMGNPPMPMYLSCSGSDAWQEKMLDSADRCMDLGADGVLYDLGGLPPYFCYDKTHNHKKPSLACEEKPARYLALHDHIHARSEDNLILMEHTVDVYNQHMDIVHGSNSGAKKNDLIELYRYTFPEFVITNRECGQDESDYLNAVNRSVLYGLRFDMTIWRCCGSLSDIPRYAAYLKEVNALREKHADTLLRGRFTDEEGFALDDGTDIRAKSFLSDKGTRAVVLWNTGDTDRAVTVTLEGGAQKKALVKAQRLYVIENK